MALPANPKPPVFYRFSATRRRWEYAFTKTDIVAGKGIRSDVVHTQQPVLAEYEIKNIRRQWSERSIIFVTNPTTGRSALSRPVVFTALGEEVPVKKTPAVRLIKYHYNEGARPPRWMYVLREGEPAQDSWNLRNAGPILTAEEVRDLRTHWARLNDADETFDVRVTQPTLPNLRLFYRYADGVWQFFINNPSHEEGGCWTKSNTWAGQGPEAAVRIARDGDVVTTINGRRWEPGMVIPLGTETGRLSGNLIGRALGGSPGVAPYGGVQEQLAAMERSLQRAVDYAALYGTPQQAAQQASPVEEIDPVLNSTIRARRARGPKRAIPQDREWLSSDGDLIDLTLISDEYLANIVNLVVRGARVSGGKIARTPERVRQGLNAAAEQARRVEKASILAADCMAALGKINGLTQNVGGKR